MSAQATLANAPPQLDVSPGNPCPFLRALVAGGWLNDEVEPLGKLRDTIVRASGRPLPGAVIVAIAAIANGLTPAPLLRNARNARKGLRLSTLRGGPLDKRGSGSRLIDAKGQFQAPELKRLASFASPKPLPQGGSELGLSLPQITAMMDANFARARSTRRRVDRAMMNAEWPMLVKFMGKDVADGSRYLCVDEVQVLVRDRRLPGRVVERLGGGRAGV
jgi:hypothetical protein